MKHFSTKTEARKHRFSLELDYINPEDCTQIKLHFVNNWFGSNEANYPTKRLQIHYQNMAGCFG